MISIAILLSAYFIIQYKNIAYPLVVIWALWGIKASQGTKSALINQLTVVGILLIAVLVLSTAIKKVLRK